MPPEHALWIVASGAGTGVGALFLFLVRCPSDRQLDTLLGFTAGVMLAATAFSLLVPALQRGTLLEIVVGLLLGGAFLAALDIAVPHVHQRFDERPSVRTGPKRQSILLVLALTIHNIPEGMAVGVAFAAGGAKLGVPIALAIGLQNIPEGFAAGAPLVHTSEQRVLPAVIAGATGLAEPPAAFAAFFALSVSKLLLPAGLA